MAVQTFRANLRASDFPLLSDEYGNSVVIAGNDMHYIRANDFTGANADKNIGIPQILFCENVMPTSDGYQSIDFLSPISAGGSNLFDQAFYLRDASENRTLFVPAGGLNFIYKTTINSWVSNFPVVPPANAIVSVATLKGRTFVHYSNYANFLEWSGTTLGNVTLVGLVAANIRGLTTANSYLIAWDFDTIYWSSSNDPADFVPSLSTGAGSQKVLGLKGRIVYCKMVEDGFVIHTTTQAHYAKYSGNIRFPWVFSELKGSSGIGFQDDAADDAHGTKTYVYTNDGLMVYDRAQAQQIYPTVNEFLSCGKIESYNYTTGNIELATYTDRLRTKVAFIGSRWLVISYGLTTNMTHALIYDTSLQRWGKIRLDHVDCFEFFGNPGTASVASLAWDQVVGDWSSQVNPWSAWGTIQSGGLSSSTTPYRSLGFLCKDGQVKVVNFNFNNVDALSKLYLGKFQFIRGKKTRILATDIQGLNSNVKCKFAILTSYEGYTVDKKTFPVKVIDEPKHARYQMNLTGENHILDFEGNFQLTNVQLQTMLAGDR